ncbi:MAG: SRPBCC family protein [Gemmatimonas sp.]
MQIEKQFTVSAPADVVWKFLTDPHKVAACLPGAAITGQTDDKTYAGTITVKVGPLATSYRGEVRFERLDAETRTADVVARGQDVRGKGGADLKMTSRIKELGGGETEVTVVQDIAVTGILAQMGRGMIEDVGDQLFERFLAAMKEQLATAATPSAPLPAPASPSAPAPASEPIQALSFGAGVASRAGGRLLRRPTVWVGAIVIALALWWLMSR